MLKRTCVVSSLFLLYGVYCILYTCIVLLCTRRCPILSEKFVHRRSLYSIQRIVSTQKRGYGDYPVTWPLASKPWIMVSGVVPFSFIAFCFELSPNSSSWVTLSLSNWLTDHFWRKTQIAILDICDHWDIWSEWWEDMTRDLWSMRHCQYDRGRQLPFLRCFYIMDYHLPRVLWVIFFILT